MKLSILSRAWRLCAAAALAGAAALTTAAVPAQAAVSPHYTAQGGCNEYSVGSTGFELGVCINDRGTGTTAYPDIYVNQVGKYSGSCSIGIELWDNHSKQYGSTAQAGCGKGHYTGNAYGPVAHATVLHTFARLKINGTSYYFAGKGDSPSISLSEQQLSYDYSFPVANGTTPQTVLSFAVRNFGTTFLHSDCTSLSPGETCVLKVLKTSNPVLVVSVTPTSWTFQSLPGHTEGIGRTITFSFTQQGNETFLEVNSHGPMTLWSTISLPVVRGLWQAYATNLSYALAGH